MLKSSVCCHKTLRSAFFHTTNTSRQSSLETRASPPLFSDCLIFVVQSAPEVNWQVSHHLNELNGKLTRVWLNSSKYITYERTSYLKFARPEPKERRSRKCWSELNRLLKAKRSQDAQPVCQTGHSPKNSHSIWSFKWQLELHENVNMLQLEIPCPSFFFLLSLHSYHLESSIRSDNREDRNKRDGAEWGEWLGAPRQDVIAVTFSD